MPEIKPPEGTCLGGEELLEKLEYVLFMIHHTAFQRRWATIKENTVGENNEF